MKLIGIDLSGPTNTADTAVAQFSEDEGKLHLEQILAGASDETIYSLVQQIASDDALIVGLDAPLSYQPGGGDRPSDRALRKRITEAGMKSGSVMTPTMTRMAYLTLRGVAVARGIEQIGGSQTRLVEIHPGASFALHGAPIEAVRGFKRDTSARAVLIEWLEQNGFKGLEGIHDPDDHTIAALGTVLGAWRWYQGKSAWCEPAVSPVHPYDFAA
ncbi:MAG: DUF429 domain-containing protein [Verrucomicrobiota bacterium]